VLHLEYGCVWCRKLGYFVKVITNIWKVLKCRAGRKMEKISWYRKCEK
jgi:hypothetical protein